MRRYKAPSLVCLTCGKAVRINYGGSWDRWEHVERVGITNPAWHLAKVA